MWRISGTFRSSIHTTCMKVREPYLFWRSERNQFPLEFNNIIQKEKRKNESNELNKCRTDSNDRSFLISHVAFNWRMQWALTNGVTDIINHRLVQMSAVYICILFIYFLCVCHLALECAIRWRSNESSVLNRSAIKSPTCRILWRCVVWKVVRFSYFRFFLSALLHGNYFIIILYLFLFCKLNLLPAIHKSDRLFLPQTMHVNWKEQEKSLLRTEHVTRSRSMSPWNIRLYISSHHVVRYA